MNIRSFRRRRTAISPPAKSSSARLPLTTACSPRLRYLPPSRLNIRTGQPITEDELNKDEYTGKDFDDELFIDMRTPAMCADLFKLLCENGGPEQKVIIFCNREIHADRVAMQMNNLYAKWCRENSHEPKDLYAFKCMGGPNNGADIIEPMRGSGERAFIACTVDLLEAGVDIERLKRRCFLPLPNPSIKFYQMVGRGTRIHEETQKYKFWLYDYTGVTDLFGTDFITPPPRPKGGGGSGGDESGGDDSGDGGGTSPPVPEIPGHTDHPPARAASSSAGAMGAMCPSRSMSTGAR